MIYSTGSNIKVFACNSNRDLAESIAKKLGLKLGDAEVEKFSDGEISVLKVPFFQAFDQSFTVLAGILSILAART